MKHSAGDLRVGGLFRKLQQKSHRNAKGTPPTMISRNHQEDVPFIPGVSSSPDDCVGITAKGLIPQGWTSCWLHTESQPCSCQPQSPLASLPLTDAFASGVSHSPRSAASTLPSPVSTPPGDPLPSPRSLAQRAAPIALPMKPPFPVPRPGPLSQCIAGGLGVGC